MIIGIMGVGAETLMINAESAKKIFDIGLFFDRALMYAQRSISPDMLSWLRRVFSYVPSPVPFPLACPTK